MTELTMRKYDVVTFGDLCVDFLMSGEDVVPEFGQVEKIVEDYFLEMGGSCSIFACQAAKLGLKVAILGKVGKDQFGDLILSRMQESGVDIRYVEIDPELKTGCGIALCKPDGDRAIMTYMGSINVLTEGDVKDEWLGLARHLHHGSYYLHTGLRPGIPGIFRRAKAMGLTISLDTNWDPEERWGEGLEEVIGLVDVFLPNEAEALRIANTERLQEAVSCLHAMGTKIIAVKRGAKGAMASDGSTSRYCSVEPVSGGDSVGAGDSFDAGFLAGWLKGLPLEQSLKIGCACGRSVASQFGGVRGQLTWEEAVSSP
jgi:sugar/nucleoside kinase (ribokinase family)